MVLEYAALGSGKEINWSGVLLEGFVFLNHWLKGRLLALQTSVCMNVSLRFSDSWCIMNVGFRQLSLL